jgi:hypothetical protein
MARTLRVARDGAAKRFVVSFSDPQAAPDGVRLDNGLFGPEALPADGSSMAENSMFSLKAPGTLSIHGEAAAPTDNDYRVAVVRAFDDFLERVEGLEGKTLRVGVTSLIRRLLANQITATFPESLYFQCGFLRQASPFRQVVDLQPGMRLRVECQVSQLVPDGGEAGTNFAHGYVAAAQAYYHVIEALADNGQPRLSLDAFLAAGIPPEVTPSPGGVAGLIDLAGSAFAKRWLRLCYPAQFGASDSSGWTGTQGNVTLLGADTLAALNAATEQCVAGNRVTTPGAVAAFFRGRTYLVPEVMVLVNNAPHYVPLGTTVRQLFGRFCVLPRMGNFVPGSFHYFRFAPVGTLRRTVVNPLPGYPNPYRPVLFESSPVAGPDAFDLPVLAGDGYNFAFASDTDFPLVS